MQLQPDAVVPLSPVASEAAPNLSASDPRLTRSAMDESSSTNPLSPKPVEREQSASRTDQTKPSQGSETGSDGDRTPMKRAGTRKLSRSNESDGEGGRVPMQRSGTRKLSRSSEEGGSDRAPLQRLGTRRLSSEDGDQNGQLRRTNTSRHPSEESLENGVAKVARAVQKAISKRTMSFKGLRSTKAEKGVQTKREPEHSNAVVSFLEELCQLTEFSYGEVWVRPVSKEAAGMMGGRNRVHPLPHRDGSIAVRRTGSGRLFGHEGSITLTAKRMFKEASNITSLRATKSRSMVDQAHGGALTAAAAVAREQSGLTSDTSGPGRSPSSRCEEARTPSADVSFHHPNGTSTVPSGGELFSASFKERMGLNVGAQRVEGPGLRQHQQQHQQQQLHHHQPSEQRTSSAADGERGGDEEVQDDVLPFDKGRMSAGETSPHSLPSHYASATPPLLAQGPHQHVVTPWLRKPAGDSPPARPPLAASASASPPMALPPGLEGPGGSQAAGGEIERCGVSDAAAGRDVQGEGSWSVSRSRGKQPSPAHSPMSMSMQVRPTPAIKEDEAMVASIGSAFQQQQQQPLTVGTSLHKEGSLIGKLTGMMSKDSTSPPLDLESGRARARNGRRFSMNKFFGGSGSRRQSVRHNSLLRGMNLLSADAETAGGEGDDDPRGDFNHFRDPPLASELVWSGMYYCSEDLQKDESESKPKIDEMVALAKDTVYSKGAFAFPSLAWAKKDLNWHDLTLLDDDDDLVADRRVAAAKHVPFGVSVGIPIFNRSGKTRAVVMLYRQDESSKRRSKIELERDAFIESCLHLAQDALPAVLDVEETLKGFRSGAAQAKADREGEDSEEEEGRVLVPSTYKASAQNFLAAYFSKFAGQGAQAPTGHDWSYAWWAFIGTLLSMMVITSVDEYLLREIEYKDGNLFALLASFGAVSAMLFAAPTSQLVQPRNLIGGHIIGVTVALCLDYLTNDDYFPVLPRWFAIALSPAISIAVMALMGLIHPPAGAASVIYISGNEEIKNLSWLFLALPILADVVLLIGMAIIVNNMSRKRKYPLFW